MKPKTNSIIRYIAAFITIIVIALFDQYTKNLVVEKIPLHKEVSVIGDALDLTQVHNSGAAWSSFSGKIPFLLILTAVLSVILIYVYIKVRDNKRFNLVRVLIVFVIGGAIGNMLDRIRLGYVVDFIYVKLIDFPVFNVADIFVTVSIFILFFLFAFKYDSKDLDEAFKKKDKQS